MDHRRMKRLKKRLNWEDLSKLTNEELYAIHAKIFKCDPILHGRGAFYSELLGVAYTQIRNPDSNLSLLGRS